jgi:hypothetical protein
MTSAQPTPSRNSADYPPRKRKATAPHTCPAAKGAEFSRGRQDQLKPAYRSHQVIELTATVATRHGRRWAWHQSATAKSLIYRALEPPARQPSSRSHPSCRRADLVVMVLVVEALAGSRFPPAHGWSAQTSKPKRGVGRAVVPGSRNRSWYSPPNCNSNSHIIRMPDRLGGDGGRPEVLQKQGLLRCLVPFS